MKRTCRDEDQVRLEREQLRQNVHAQTLSPIEGRFALLFGDERVDDLGFLFHEPRRRLTVN